MSLSAHLFETSDLAVSGDDDVGVVDGSLIVDHGCHQKLKAEALVVNQIRPATDECDVDFAALEKVADFFVGSSLNDLGLASKHLADIAMS